MPRNATRSGKGDKINTAGVTLEIFGRYTSYNVIDRWMDGSIDRFEPAFVGVFWLCSGCVLVVFWGFYRIPQENHDQAAIRKNVIECEMCLSLLGDQLAEKPFLIGNHPTLADIATGVFLHRIQTIELKVEMPDNIQKWYQRLSARPPYRQWVMSDYSELRGRLGY